ncbi:hypothetical protein HETIRDRAFT_146471 [Heterobasidion irregulare TC 32-1]|uniref:N-acetyltransferase domain-containing protein n=1 Tax=Heterobasidion irregulare (strain TC 32-1) TaxID=747525 RepID=W4K5I4_HETIT|nr:uncharacterized protein HETIRDRAFT_146471 [Heterobasidion irregulare TC 32-1]ETW81072.1 hypothetical protein HETIRDRAFT_146471 [Heterobasidion irregulare TC 32-1]
MTSVVYIHENPMQTVLPHLEEYLPFANNPHYMIVVPPVKVEDSPTEDSPAKDSPAKDSPAEDSPAKDSLVIASFEPFKCPPKDKPWAVATTDFTRPGEAEFWFWSSIEASEVDIRDKGLLEESCNLLKSMVTLIVENHKDKKLLSLGCLHAAFIPFIPESSIETKTKTYMKYTFTRGHLNEPTLGEDFQGCHLGDVKDNELIKLVAASSEVYRSPETLQKYNSTAAYLDAEESKDTALGWCWTARDGTLTTLFVKEEYRNRQIAKLVMWHHLQREFVTRKFVCVDVDTDNKGSVKACTGLGAAQAYPAIWLTIDMPDFISTKVER